MSGNHERRTQTHGLTLRALLIALLLLPILAVISTYLEMVHSLNYIFAAGVPPRGPLAVLFLLIALNALIARRGRLGLSRRELLVIFCLLTVGAPLLSHGMLFWILACSTGQYYFVRSAPHWEAHVLPHVPRWFAPTDYLPVEGFFLGQAPVPWAVWLTPIAAWASLLIALFLANLFLVLLLKRQWINHERLSFPIAMIPLELVRGGEDPARRSGRFPSAWPFWVGFLVGAYLNLQAQLPALVPSFPSFSTWRVLIPWQRVGPLAGLGDIWLILTTTHIAIAYLIPKELSFSVWFFWIVRVALTIAAIAAGATPQKPEDFWGSGFPAPYYQGGGAMLAIAGLLFWTIGKQFRRARQYSSGASRADAEPFAYPWLLLGFLLSSASVVYFFWLAGARLPVGIALLFVILVYHLIYTRLRAENGMSFMGLPLGMNDLLLRTIGSSVYRPAEIVTILAARWTYHVGWGESAEAVTGATFDSFKIADSARLPQRRLTSAMLAVFLFSLALGIPLVLTICYQYGFVNMHNFSGNWLHGQVRSSGQLAFDLIANPSKPDPAALGALGAGAAFTLFLNAMRLRFWWWPFHPIGYLVANAWGTQWWYMPFFVGWLAKTLVVRYGGLRLYQRTVPIAIGAIVGDILVDNVWPVFLWFARAHP